MSSFLNEDNIVINEGSVVIDQEVYEDLLTDSIYLKIILNALYKEAKLNYRKDSLQFVGLDALSTILRVTDNTGRYQRELNRLKKEEEE